MRIVEAFPSEFDPETANAHRIQLGAYPRLRDAPVPPLHGPTAGEAG
jgi:hypothetical protein